MSVKVTADSAEIILHCRRRRGQVPLIPGAANKPIPPRLEVSMGARLIIVKRRDLLKELKALAKAHGVDYLETEGGSHTRVEFGGKQTTVPRHNEINEITANSILKHMRRE